MQYDAYYINNIINTIQKTGDIPNTWWFKSDGEIKTAATLFCSINEKWKYIYFVRLLQNRYLLSSLRYLMLLKYA